MKIQTNIITGLILLLATLLLPIAANSESNELKISGATTVQPIAEKLAALYTKIYKSQVIVKGGGTGKGLTDAISGISDIGMVSRSLTEDEKAQLKFKTAGYDGIVFIVNIENPLTEIDSAKVISIFSGKIKSWDKTEKWDEQIILVSKEMGRSTLELFEKYSGLSHPALPEKGKNGTISKDTYEIGSDLESITVVGGVLGAIGYVSYGYALEFKEMGMPIKILTLDGIAASKEKILSGEYPMVRELNFVYKQNNDKVKRFIDLISSAEGQRIVEDLKFLPIKN